MIKVAVRHQHQVNFINLFQFLRANRVGLYPGIDQDNLSLGSGDLKAGMPKPGDLYAVHLHFVFSHDCVFLLETNMVSFCSLVGVMHRFIAFPVLTQAWH